MSATEARPRLASYEKALVAAVVLLALSPLCSYLAFVPFWIGLLLAFGGLIANIAAIVRHGKSAGPRPWLVLTGAVMAMLMSLLFMFS